MSVHHDPPAKNPCEDDPEDLKQYIDERALKLASLPYKEAMQRPVEASLEHPAAHPAFIQLVSLENMQRSQYAR